MEKMKESLIAPCGMNCATCIHFLFYQGDFNKQGFHKQYCPGCIARGKGCTYSMAKNCDKIKHHSIRFCHECSTFPCKSLKALDKRYKTKYHMSMIENLNQIREEGMHAFLKAQDQKYACPNCDGTICTHNGLCLACNLGVLKTNKKHCWDRED